MDWRFWPYLHCFSWKGAGRPRWKRACRLLASKTMCIRDSVDTMRRVFDLDCEIIDDPVSGAPLIVQRGKCVP